MISKQHFVCIFSTICIFMAFVTASGGEIRSTPPEPVKLSAKAIRDYGLSFEHVKLEIPGLKRAYTFIWISDLHLISEDISEISPEKREMIARRRDKRFANPRSGKNPVTLWRALPDMLNKSGADMIFLGGDICDYGSIENIKILKDGIKKLTVPTIFLREDHESTTRHMISSDTDIQKKLNKEIDGHPAIHIKEFADLIIVGIDNSVFQLRPEVLAKFKEVYAKNKPVIVLMHVPIYPAVNQDMKWITPRHNIWGARRRPHKPMAEFIKLVKTPNGPVKAVFSGHNHKSWEGLLAPGVKMNIFNPAFEGNIGVITVTPGSTK